MKGVKVVVVGAGPAGVCAAMALANLGASVTVCEARSEETFAGTSTRSYVIILQDRGLAALEAAGFTGLITPESKCVFHRRCCQPTWRSLRTNWCPPQTAAL